MEKCPLPFHITGRHGRTGFRSSRYAPGPPWKTPPSPSILRVGTAHSVSGLPDKDPNRHRNRPLPFHITGRYGRIGFRSSKYAPGPPFGTPPSPFIFQVGTAHSISGLPDKDPDRYGKRPLPFHITGRYGRIGFRSSKYAMKNASLSFHITDWYGTCSLPF